MGTASHVIEYAQAKTVEYSTARVAENTWRILNTIASIRRENMLGYLSAGIICSGKRTDSESVAREKLWALRNR